MVSLCCEPWQQYILDAEDNEEFQSLLFIVCNSIGQVVPVVQPPVQPKGKIILGFSNINTLGFCASDTCACACKLLPVKAKRKCCNVHHEPQAQWITYSRACSNSL